MRSFDCSILLYSVIKHSKFTLYSERTAASYRHVLPDGIEDVERDVESDFSREAFDCDEHGVREPDPADEPQREQRIARWRLVQVQYQSRIEHLIDRANATEHPQLEHSNSGKKSFDSILFANLINLPLVH